MFQEQVARGNSALMERVDWLARQCPVLQNRYFAALENDGMSREEFVASQRQFYFAVRYFSRPMSALLARMADSATRQGLIHNLAEEHGFEGDDETLPPSFDPAVAHDLTFLAFLRSMGVSTRQMGARRQGPVVRAFNTALMGTCMMEPIEVAFSCLGVIEYTFADICALIGKKVVARGWVSKDELVHYKLHAEIDKRHAADFFNAVGDSWQNGGAGSFAVEDGVMLGLHLFNRLYEDLCKISDDDEM